MLKGSAELSPAAASAPAPASSASDNCIESVINILIGLPDTTFHLQLAIRDSPSATRNLWLQQAIIASQDMHIIC